MPILVSDDAPVLFVHDTDYNDQPLTIFFNLQGVPVEAIYNSRVIKIEDHREMISSVLKDCVFPYLAKVQTETPPVETPPSVEVVPPTTPKPRANAVHTSTIDTATNPAEALRREVAAEKEMSSSPIADIHPDEVIHTHSVCNRCPVACKVDITHTPTGKFIGVTGNACERGVGYAQNFLLEKFAQAL